MGWCECPQLEKDGYRYSQFFGSLLAECVYTPAEYIPSTFGLISVLCWMIGAFPQYYKNYRTKQAEAVSPIFITIRTLGDLGFFASCIMLQFPTPVFIQAIWFMTDNFVMFGQMGYYGYIYPRMRKRSPHATVISMTTMCAVVLLAAGAFTPAILSPTVSIGKRLLLSEGVPRPGNCNYEPQMSDTIVLWGVILSWWSSILNPLCRLPQLYKNYADKQCEGLSLYMFALFAMANLTFMVQVLMRQTIYWQLIVGSFGPFMIDCAIIIQAKMYNKNPQS